MQQQPLSAPQEGSFFFRGPDNAQLYGLYYPPLEAAGPRPGVVLASPLARERLRCYRESASLARFLGARGFPVLRFDYRGEGESDGDFASATLRSRAEDLRAAMAELQRRAGVDQVCLVGIHVGALVALMAVDLPGEPREAPREPPAGGPRGGSRVGLVLVDPVCAPERFARSMLRSNIVLQTHYFGHVTQDEEALRQAMAQGAAVSVYGFQLGLPLLQELEALDTEALLARQQGRAAVVHLAIREGPPKPDVQRWLELLGRQGEAASICAVMSFSWTSRRRWIPSLAPLNAAVLAGLERVS